MNNHSELRLGNWVKTNKITSTVTNLGKDYIGVERDSYLPKEVEGVELTEEWLLKFGFEKEDGSDDSYLLEKWLALDTDAFMANLIIEREGLYVRFGLSETRYVHQLQNLYFALTGEELEYMPKSVFANG